MLVIQLPAGEKSIEDIYIHNIHIRIYIYIHICRSLSRLLPASKYLWTPSSSHPGCAHVHKTVGGARARQCLR